MSGQMKTDNGHITTNAEVIHALKLERDDLERQRNALYEAGKEALEELYRVSPSRAAPKLRAALALIESKGD